MQAILEYAYTGEVIVRKDKIREFLEACKDLHIKGLDNMVWDLFIHIFRLKYAK